MLSRGQGLGGLHGAARNLGFPEGRREPLPAVQWLGSVFYFWSITVDSRWLMGLGKTKVRPSGSWGSRESLAELGRGADGRGRKRNRWEWS